MRTRNERYFRRCRTSNTFKNIATAEQRRRGKHRKRWVGIIGTGKDRRRATLYTPQGDRIETDAKAADAAVKRINQDTNDFNKLDESYKLTIWDNVPDSACFERLAVLLTRHAHDQRITSITPAHLPRCVQSAPCNAPGFRFWSNAVR